MRFRNFLMSQTKARRLRSFWRERKATSAIELALVLPLVAGMIVPLTDLGMGAYTKMQVQNAAQAGADYALKNAGSGFNATNIGTAVTSATSLSGVTADPTPTESCACVGGTPAVITNTTAPPCVTGCASGSEGVYVTVNAQASYTPLFPYPAIPSSITFNATSIVRVQ
jgi:Flp pilus assembly protein TadG